jgi:two-component system, cell cycle sensor histidine kinase and response regulator CckA
MDVMDMYAEIDAVYQRALLIQQRATESPIKPKLVEEALDDLLFVLDELQASQLELRRQNQELVATRAVIEWERQRYKVLFELAPDGYLVTDRQGTIYDANVAAGKLFAIEREYLISKPLIVLIDESDRPSFQQRLINLDQKRNWPVLIKPQKGEARSAMIAVTKIEEEFDGDGMRDERAALLWLFRDNAVA